MPNITFSYSTEPPAINYNLDQNEIDVLREASLTLVEIESELWEIAGMGEKAEQLAKFNEMLDNILENKLF